MLLHFISKKDLGYQWNMRMGLRDDKDDCPFRRNFSGFIQWSVQTLSGLPGKVLRIQKGDFRASPCHHLLGGGLGMKSHG